jgi:hypothetical protein
MPLSGTGAGRMFTGELYAGIRRTVMVKELRYMLLAAVDSERDIFCFAYSSPQQSPLSYSRILVTA